MRIGGDHGFEVRGAERRHVRSRKHFVESFLPNPAHVVAGVRFAIVEDAEIHAGLAEQGGEGLTYLLVARVEGGVVADEPEYVHRLFACVLDGKGQRLRPCAALTPRLAEAVAGLVDGLQCLREQRFHRPLLDQLGVVQLVDNAGEEAVGEARQSRVLIVDTVVGHQRAEPSLASSRSQL